MKKFIVSCLVIFVSLFFLFFIWIGFFGPEQYYIFDPYIDTEMASNYSPEKFAKIQYGMTKSEVIKIIGDPLFTSIDSLETETLETLTYTNDGKIIYKKMPWYMFNDYAWYRSILKFNIKGNVISINKGWSYD